MTVGNSWLRNNLEIAHNVNISNMTLFVIAHNTTLWKYDKQVAIQDIYLFMNACCLAQIQIHLH